MATGKQARNCRIYTSYRPICVYIYICACVCVCVRARAHACVCLLEFYTSWNSVSLEFLLSLSLLLIFKIILYIKFPWHHFGETNIHLTFQPNWKAAMCLIAKRNALYYTILFYFLYLISIALIVHACIWIFLALRIKNSVKVLNNPGVVFLGIWHKRKQFGSPKLFS
jgi:hypothetical protein